MKSTSQTLLLPFIKQSHIGTSVNKPPADAPEAAGWHHAHGVDP
jgi:hypothetical protein